jgi:2-dehydropantoate 2-reductase
MIGSPEELTVTDNNNFLALEAEWRSNPRWEGVTRPYQASDVEKLRAPVTTRLRREIWVKLLGNAAFNPISALTGATLVQMARDPETSALVRNIMGEVEAVANKLGMELPVSIDQRIAGAEKIGEHKTSMLQDLEAGRPLELEAIVGAVIETGEHVGVTMPHARAVYACTKLREKVSMHKDERPSAQTTEHRLPALGDNEA